MLCHMSEREVSRLSVILWHPDGQRVALQETQWPPLDLERGGDLTGTVKVEWAVEAWLLDDAGSSFGLTGMPRLRALSTTLPAHLTWAHFEVPALPFERPWQRPDWPERLSERLALAGIQALETRLVHTNDLVNIVQVTTPSGKVYLKTASSSHEARFTEYVTANFPRLSPPLLACHAGERWQITASGGQLLDAVDDLEAWQQAILRLVEFQQSADAGALADLGAPAHPLADLPAQVEDLLSDKPTLQFWGVPDDQIRVLQAAQPRIERAFQQVAALNLPDRPAHGDAHPRNALQGERGSVWFDWSEVSSAAHPLMDLGWFLAFALHPAREKLPIRRACPNLETELSTFVGQALGLPPSSAPQISAAIPLAYLHRAVVYDLKFRGWTGNLPGWQPQYVPYYLRQAARELERLEA